MENMADSEEFLDQNFMFSLTRLVHKVFETNSSFHVKQHSTGKV